MRIRLRFTETGKVRFVSHRDVARIWDRALRRARLPVASTEGFSPRPKVHFGLALSTGHESMGEYLDVDLRDDAVDGLDVAALPALLTPLLPPGIEVEAAAEVDRRTTSLQQAVVACTWQLDVPGVDPSTSAAAVARALRAEELPLRRVRKGKERTDDVRPAIVALEVAGPVPADRPGPGSVLVAELATQPRGVRPAELLAVLDPTWVEGRVVRLHQWIDADGARQEPLPAATRPARAEVRAS